MKPRQKHVDILPADSKGRGARRGTGRIRQESGQGTGVSLARLAAPARARWGARFFPGGVQSCPTAPTPDICVPPHCPVPVWGGGGGNRPVVHPRMIGGSCRNDLPRLRRGHGERVRRRPHPKPRRGPETPFPLASPTPPPLCTGRVGRKGSVSVHRPGWRACGRRQPGLSRYRSRGGVARRGCHPGPGEQSLRAEACDRGGYFGAGQGKGRD